MSELKFAPNLKFPDTLKIAFQPYGWYTITNCRIVEHLRNPSVGGSRDIYEVVGEVVEGMWCGALWAGVPVAPAQSLKGETKGIWGLTQEEIDHHVKTGESIVRVAM